MKKRCLLMTLTVIVVLPFSTAWAQGWAARHSLLPADLNGVQTIETSDGGYLVGGNLFDEAIEIRSYYLAKIDSWGMPGWDRVLRQGDRRLVAIAEGISPQGMPVYYLLGETAVVDDQQPQRDLSATVLTVVDDQSNLLWEKVYHFPDRHVEPKALIVDDSGITIAGDIGSTSSLDEDFWVLRVDRFGHVVWNRHYDHGAFEEVSSIAQTSGGNYIVAGYWRTLESTLNMWVVELDSFGRLGHQRDFVSEAHNYPAQILVVDQWLSESEYLLVGWTTASPTHSTSDTFIMRLSWELYPQWTKRYNTVGDEGMKHSFATAAAVQPFTPDEGRLIVTGVTQDEWAGNDDSFVLRVDPSYGHLISHNHWGGFDHDWLVDVHPNYHDGFIVTGSTVSQSPGGELQLWLMAFDRYGWVGGEDWCFEKSFNMYEWEMSFDTELGRAWEEEFPMGVENVEPQVIDPFIEVLELCEDIPLM